jgi:hypothetical protein
VFTDHLIKKSYEIILIWIKFKREALAYKDENGFAKFAFS